MHTAVASAETLNQPTSSNTNGAAAEQDASAFLLESLLHELIFWEPTPKEFLLRKRSHSVNAVLDSAVVTSPHRKGELRHVSSCGNGATMNNGTYIHNDAPQQQCHRLQPSKNQQQPSNATKGLQLQQQQQQPRSPTLQDLQAACHWQKAVDPATGRTYYYDVLTRQTQWEKVSLTLT